jgi:outer membrane protein assembly factor BamB
MAISLASGKVLWTHPYHSPDGGPNGVTVASGRVYAATATTAVALNAATGAQVWRRPLIHTGHEEINMAPGYHNGTVYVSSSPVSTTSEYAGHGTSVLWALNAATGAPEWTWDEVQNLWGKPAVNSGGGQWYPPSFDSQGNIYLGVANPGPESGHPCYPWGTSRPGPDLYTDSVVKLSPQGKLLWYYQLTPHDVHDWDLQNPPVLTTAAGKPVVVDGGKAGILVELDARTGKLLWQLPVGVHNGHDNDGLLTEHARPSAHLPLPKIVCVAPGGFGGIESQLASNGSTTFAAVNNMPMLYLNVFGAIDAGGFPGLAKDLNKAGGELVAVSQDTGKLEWDDKLPSSPYGAATVTNNVVFTTTYNGDLYAVNATTGAILLKRPMSAGSNSPVAIDGDYVLAGAGVVHSAAQRPLLIAYKLGATGHLPSTAGP